MKRLWLCLALVACAPPAQNDLNVRVEVSNPRVGRVPIVLLLEYQNKPLENAVVTVRGDMTHAGMSPVQQVARASGKGRYVLDGFGFTMSGDWVLSISAKTNGKTLLGEAKLGVNP
jgi:hypothetical protein